MTIATKNGSVILKDGSVAQNCGCCDDGGWYCYAVCCELCGDSPSEVEIVVQAAGDSGMPWVDTSPTTQSDNRGSWTIAKRNISFPSINETIVVPLSLFSSGSGQITSGGVTATYGKNPSDICSIGVSVTQSTESSLIYGTRRNLGDGQFAEIGDPAYTGYAFERRTSSLTVVVGGSGENRPRVRILQSWTGMNYANQIAPFEQSIKEWKPASAGPAECRSYSSFPLTVTDSGVGYFYNIGGGPYPPPAVGGQYQVPVGGQNTPAGFGNQIRIGSLIQIGVTIR